MRAAVEDFVAAFNSGDEAQVFAALSPAFHLYSERGYLSESRDIVARDLAARAKRGERFELVSLEATTLVAWDGAGHFGPIRLALYADGARRPLEGKGAAYCAGHWRGIRVLGLGP